MKLLHGLWIMNLAAFSLSPSAAFLGVRPRIRRILDERDVIGTFSQPDIHHYSILKMSIRGDVLYVGARDAILALNPRNVTEELHPQVDWSPPLKQKEQCSMKGRSATTECFNFIRVLEEVNDTCLLVCGTYAFQPMCAYIDRKGFSLVRTEADDVQIFSGRGMSPYNPADTSTATFAGGELYSGTSNDFLGTEHVIRRTVGTRKDIDSEHQRSWLNEPRFVASEFVPEDPSSPEDDKIYYFFTEIVSEFNFNSPVTVSRIARVCKGDKGGQKLLIGKWTSFLKARLGCSLQSKDLYFNQLIQDVFTLHRDPSGGTEEPTFYATFISQVGKLNISTVCKYDLSAVRQAFSGKFYEERNANSHHFIPKPRPGQCLKDQRSQSLPDQTLKFVRDHSLMNAVVQPSGEGPLLVSDNARYTHLAVERLTSLSGRQLDVLYLATDRGFLHKAINVDGEMYLFEELRLFEGNQPVQNLLLDPRQSMLYVASSSQVLQLRTANCATLKTCADCLLARDPHCAWDMASVQCRHVGNDSDSKEWKQDVENANVAELCPTHAAQEPKYVKEKIIEEGVDLVMRCSLQSYLASMVWERDGKPLPNNDKHYEVLSVEKGLTTLLVIKSPEPKHNGTYVCWAVEGQSHQKIEVYAVSLPREPPTTTPQTTVTTTMASTTIRTTNRIISTSTAHVATTSPNHENQSTVTDVPTTGMRLPDIKMIQNQNCIDKVKVEQANMGLLVAFVISLAVNVALVLLVLQQARECKKQVARLVQCEMPETSYGREHRASGMSITDDPSLCKASHHLSKEVENKTPLMMENESQA
uniref:semaphorin-4C-like isoform X2 n=1 Tax=Myxine glutinosa TaxID=7769 RepID=UPI00358F7C6E